MDTVTEAAAAAGTRRVDQLLAHYGESHRNPRNERIHFVAIPLIMASLLGLIWAAHPWLAYAFVGASLVYYARLSVVFLLAMAVLSALALWFVGSLGALLLPVSVIVFVAAWIAQFIGHKIEGRKPSFFEDLQYLWVGPLFVLARLFERLGVRW
jgi:uncharacterized membrane protein YGL010W